MEQKRLQKLESIAKKIASEHILWSLTEEEDIFWIITITQVKVSTDLSYLDIYVSSMQNKENLTKVLASRAYKLQKEIAKNISIKKIPRVRFRYDDAWEISSWINHTLHSLDINNL